MKVLILLLSLLISQFSPVNAQTWLWGRQGMGGFKPTTNGFGSPVATDNLGNAYWAGTADKIMIFGTDTLNSFQLSTFLVKCSPSGQFIWSIGPKNGSGPNGCYAVTVDTFGYIYLTGVFQTSLTFGAYTLTDSPNNSGTTFLAKIDKNGNIIWAKQAVTPSLFCTSHGSSVAVDNNGYIYLTGSFSDTVTFGSHLISTSFFAENIPCVFLTKYDPNGNVIWANAAKIHSPSSNCIGTSVSVDNMGSVYLTGVSSDTITFGSQNLIAPIENTFVVKYDTSGNIKWATSPISTSTKQNNESEGSAIITDKSGNAYITGWFYGNLIFGQDTLNSFTPTKQQSAYLAKCDLNGNFKWGLQSYGPKTSNNGAFGSALSKDNNDNIYLAGAIYGDSLTISNHLFTSPYINFPFLIKYDTAANYICGSSLTDGCPNSTVGVSSNPSGSDVYLAGTFVDSVFFKSDTLFPSIHGDANPYLARWQACCSPNSLYSITGTSTIKFGDSTVLTVSPVGLNYVWSNGATTSSITVSPATNTAYSVTVYDTTGCPANTSIAVDIECGSIFIPNAFSPNKDGENDILYVRGDCIRTMDFNIYDRWGNKVFESTNLNDGWDGTYKGQAENNATFAYYLNATLYNGNVVTKHGNVALIR